MNLTQLTQGEPWMTPEEQDLNRELIRADTPPRPRLAHPHFVSVTRAPLRRKIRRAGLSRWPRKWRRAFMGRHGG